MRSRLLGRFGRLGQIGRVGLLGQLGLLGRLALLWILGLLGLLGLLGRLGHAEQARGGAPEFPPNDPAGAAIEQTSHGTGPAPELLASFDGLGVGFEGPHGPSTGNNPSDNSIAVGLDHIVQTVNTRMAIFTKKGKKFDTTGRVLYGAVPNNTVFKGFGGACEARNNGDTVVRYDQLADRWLIVMPIFRRSAARPDQPPEWTPGATVYGSPPGIAGQPGPATPLYVPTPAPPQDEAEPKFGLTSSLQAELKFRPTSSLQAELKVRPTSSLQVELKVRPTSSLQVELKFRPASSLRPGRKGQRGQTPQEEGPYSMCYAVSATSDPLGAWYRYEFLRPLFPDYPRPAVWADGYYTPTSTSDDFVEKHVCVADRARMLKGLPATEQCVVIADVSFLNTADLDGRALPPRGAPNIVLAAGGTQLNGDFRDDGIYAWRFHVDWADRSKTTLVGPQKIAVAPYHYLCNGQLSNCVPQPGTDRRLDAQGDKIMARVVYRNVNDREMVVAVHSVNTEAGAGGVRWYEFGVTTDRTLTLHQQGTYAPDGFYRWMASPAIDKRGNIGIGYSFGGTPHFAGQRFAGRRASDPRGVLTLREVVLVEGEAAQTNTNRWEDYTQTAIDPSDDCTIWYVGDYYRKGATTYSTRIGAFRLPGCR